MKTVLETLQSGAAYLEKHGVESARLNMEHLVAHVLGCRRLQLYLDFDRPMQESELAPLRDLTKRRAAGEPLQHLLGEWEFCGRRMKCDARALIPRPETEELVAGILKRLKAGGTPPGQAIDIGCGTGAIGLALAIEIPTCQVTLADVSAEALALAAENAEMLGLGGAEGEGRLALVQSDLFAAAPGPFDLIAANLPYIPAAEIPQLAREVQHDPMLALDGGPDGLDLVRRLIAALPEALATGGLAALELGIGQPREVEPLLFAAGFESIEIEADFAGIDRFVFVRNP
ncbi:MAG: peptide chain release factor N(5)-glutamine methyltransferase [Verrucomicrobiales bacterium]